MFWLNWLRLRSRLIKPSPDFDLAACEVILAQSFGLRADGPGVSNEALAEVVRSLHLRHGLPMVLQWEVADCLTDLPMAGVIREHEEPGKYLDSREVLLQSWSICQAHGWKRAVVVAHPDHAWRVARIAHKLGFQVAVANTSQVPYDPESTQVWTRGPVRFLLREVVAVALFFWRGWI